MLITLIMGEVDYIDYPNSCVLLFGVTQRNNILLIVVISTDKNLISCLDIIEHQRP